MYKISAHGLNFAPVQTFYQAQGGAFGNSPAFFSLGGWRLASVFRPPAGTTVGRAILCPPLLANGWLLAHEEGAHGVTRPARTTVLPFLESIAGWFGPVATPGAERVPGVGLATPKVVK